MREMRDVQERQKNELEEKHIVEKAKLTTKFEAQERQQKATLLKLRKTVEDLRKEIEVDPEAGAGAGNATDDGVEEAKGHLECPICFKVMRPPTRIWQCPQSHLVCEICRDKLENMRCPSCRTETVTQRARLAERMAIALFANPDHLRGPPWRVKEDREEVLKHWLKTKLAST